MELITSVTPKKTNKTKQFAKYGMSNFHVSKSAIKAIIAVEISNEIIAMSDSITTDLVKTINKGMADNEHRKRFRKKFVRYRWTRR